jgi:ankyrin repeat protein
MQAKRLAGPAAAVDQDKDADGRTALVLAVLRGDALAVTALLKRGADPRLPDRYGQTPRGYARALGNAAVLEALGL